MPKTFWQSVLFTTVMAAFMVFIMSTYNTVLHSGGHVFFAGGKNFLAEFAVALPLALLLAGRIAPLAAHKLFGNNNPLAGIAVTFFIALIMVPLMSLFVCVRKYGADNVTFSMLGKSFLCNFALAFPVQVLFLGHAVRLIFRNSMGIKYKMRSHLYAMQPFFKNPLSAASVKVLLVTEALAVCCVSL